MPYFARTGWLESASDAELERLYADFVSRHAEAAEQVCLQLGEPMHRLLASNPVYPRAMVDESRMDPTITEVEMEALSVLSVGKDETIIGFKMEDADDVSNELSVFYRAKAFEKPTKLFAIDAALRDAWVGGGELWAVDRQNVHRLTGTLKKPKSTALPIMANAIAGSDPKNLFVVGDGVAHFDGKKWTKLAMPKAIAELKCVTVHAGVAYAAGDGGALVAIEDGKIRSLKAPTKDVNLDTIYVDAKGILSVGGDAMLLRGLADDLAAVKLPKAVAWVVGVNDFAGKTYVSAVGDGDGFGLFVQAAKKLEPVDRRIAGKLSSSEKFLYVAAESGVLRFDGKEWKVLALDFDDDKEHFNLVPRSVEEALDGDDDDEDDEDGRPR